MKKNLLSLLALALLAAGCDKIDPDEYIVYDGAVITWRQGSAIANPQQRAYVEKFTGPQCHNCPDADVTLDEAHSLYGDKLVLVSINHYKGMGTPFPGEPDMRTDGGTVWDHFYGVNGIPAAFINREKDHTYGSAMPAIKTDIGTVVAQTPSVAMEVDATADATGSNVTVHVNLDFLTTIEDALTVTVALVEDSLRYKQLMPDGSVVNDYAHNHMLRKVITGFWGRDVEADAVAGTQTSGTLTFALPADCQKANCHIVAFLSRKASRRVINSASCTLQ